MLEKLEARFKEMEENGEIDVWIEKYTINDKIEQERFDKFEKWLETNSFDELMERLILENNEHKNKCWEKGQGVYLNNKLDFVFNYVFDRYSEVTDETLENCVFPTDMRFFKGYHFVRIFGQGTIERVYKNRQRILNF